MVALRRGLLIIFVLAVPAILTGLLYYGTLALLAATNRVIDPDYVKSAAGVEFAVFTFIAILEARGRW
ncbi:MAG TPA: hypothetical protein VGG48_14565 [Rhizomicrobium sp.]|jgi:hypothetical protein